MGTQSGTSYGAWAAVHQHIAEKCVRNGPKNNVEVAAPGSRCGDFFANATVATPG